MLFFSPQIWRILFGGNFFSPGKTWCSNEEGGKNNNKYKKLYISLVAEIRDVANFYQIFILK